MGLFFLHMNAIMKKKLLVQVRDMKTLAIDTVFPVLLIICGLALATIAIFKNGEARLMSPFILPGPDPMFYNS